MAQGFDTGTEVNTLSAKRFVFKAWHAGDDPIIWRAELCDRDGQYAGEISSVLDREDMAEEDVPHAVRLIVHEAIRDGVGFNPN